MITMTPNAEEKIRELTIILRRIGEFLGFVVSNRVIPREAYESAGESGEIF